MANKEHLRVFQQGVEQWNTWRKEHPEASPDLRNADLNYAHLSGTDLSGADLRNAYLSRADLRNADLRNADLSGADLSGANLSGANLSGQDLSNKNLSGAIFNKANLSGAILSGSSFNGTNLSDADLSGANLSGAFLGGAIFSGAIFSGANLSNQNLSEVFLDEVDLNRAKLNGTDLSNANLSNLDLSEANLSGANLSGAIFNGTNLSDADLSGADLSGADLTNAHLHRTSLTGTNLSEVILRRTVLSDIDLRTAKGLETIKHETYSAFATSTLARSHGDIPEVFLRGVGVDDVLIGYVHSLYVKAIDYYTCFISYSSKDELFARRLHNDLQHEGVRCWFAPEDMDIGDKIRHRIDESIKLYDKLLLILSEHSITSTWVQYEVERALNKEPQGIPNVLYPVRVDQAIMTCSAAWAEDIKSTRHIGNFENWTDPQHYEENFKRLLRALNTKKDHLQK